LIDIKNLLVLDIDEVVSSVPEDLEPSRVGAPDLHFVSSSCTLNVPRLIVVSSSDSQGLLMEVPLLASSTISSLNDHVSVVDKIEISLLSQVGLDVECSFNIETESLIELTLLWFTLPLVSIDNIELLVDLTVSVPGNDVSVFSINTTLDIPNLLSFVGDLSSSSVPELPPS
jgi:hypothetical protein